MQNDDDREDLSENTRLTQIGRQSQRYSGFVNMPVFRGSTVLFPDAASFRTRSIEYPYGRQANPTTRALELAICEIEGGAKTFLTPSGLSAVSTVLLSFAAAGAHILISDSVYQPTRRFADRVLKRLGITVEYHDPLIAGGIERLIRKETSLILTESPGTYTFEVQDIPAICKAAAAAGVPVAMDNTWATPLYFKPLQHGVSVSFQSATKYIVGHSDALLGTITCTNDVAPVVANTHEALGVSVNSEDCFLALRGLRTMALRLEHHRKAALDIAAWLQSRPEVERVLHPALPENPGYTLWKRDFRGASGLFSIILKPVPEAAVDRFLNALRIFGMGFSWGGYESLLVPFDCTQARTATRWSPGGPALRLQIGLEDPEDLKRDLERGFRAMASGL
jgi:cystathionine beta-lyase